MEIELRYTKSFEIWCHVKFIALGHVSKFLAGQEIIQVHSKSSFLHGSISNLKVQSKCGKINCFLNTSNGANISVLKKYRHNPIEMIPCTHMASYTMTLRAF